MTLVLTASFPMDSKPTITARLLTPMLSGFGSLWLKHHQWIVLKHGSLLNASQFEDALRVGVRHPENVRILHSDHVPIPLRRLAFLCSRTLRRYQLEPVGLCAQYGIYIKKSASGDRNILVHELVHTRQYERAGGIHPFLRQYLLDCLSHGYSASTMESEAVSAAAAICA